MNSNLVEDGETLGHGVFDSSNADRKSPRSRFFKDAIRHGGRTVSVDRLDYADKDILCAVHDDEALARGDDRQFYGWYTVGSDLIRSIGLDVVPSPSTDPRNIWHADLSIPDFAVEDDDQITEYAESLKSEAKWLRRPLNPRARRDIEQATARISDNT